ncbi:MULTISPECIES: LysR family transcriptional regulator [unclassified Cupriavidus]|uniref:LysR family transcriptional regulator n=1 Tax=unclassified Cupriavidus TaxID=2640874 RepID=UPI0010FA054A|nr:MULTISPECIES: LysR family transcriptional regulator [unclassified Cupriavidus]MWL86481.1 LysR family transcriptional regulator [Cupriavidus sp. SW-Y-13]
MRLRQIEVFRAVMLTGTVSEAARLLHVSQPVVTRVLQHAEASLGFRLFDRQRGRLQPTPEAVALYGDVERLYGEIERVRRVSESLRHKGAGRLRVAATPSLANPLLVPAVRRFCARHPETQVQVLTHHTNEIVAALLANQIDVGFAFSPPLHEAITSQPVATGRMLLAVPREQPLPAGRRGVVPIRKVMERPFIGYDDDSSLGLLVRQTLARHALEPHSTLEVQTYSLALALVDAGLGLTLLDQYTALSANPDHVTLHDVQPELGFEIQMLRASHRGASSLVDDMHAQFTAAAGALAATLDDRLAASLVHFDPPGR